MTSVSQEFNPDKFNFTRINRKNELVCELRNKDCDKSPGVPAMAEARDVVIINVSPIDLGHCLLVPELELCQPQVNMFIWHAPTRCIPPMIPIIVFKLNNI